MLDRSALEQVAGRHLEALQSYCVIRVYPADDELQDEVPQGAAGAPE